MATQSQRTLKTTTRLSPAEIARTLRLNKERTACLASFPTFVRHAWPHALASHTTISGMREGDKLPKYMHAVAIHLQAWAQGDVDLLVINEPPGVGKSMLARVLLPAWIWAKEPTEVIMCGSYSDDPTDRDSGRALKLVKSEWYQSLFGGRFSIEKETIDKWDLSSGGGWISVSRSGKGTGFRSTRIIIDDPLKQIEAWSDAAKKEALLWITDTLWNRGFVGNPVRICLIMQRLADDDPAAWLIKHEKTTHLCLPAIYEPSRHCKTTVIDPETKQPWTDWRSKAGDLLCPEQQSQEYLDDQRKTSPGFSGQFQQDPIDSKTSMFPRALWRFYKLPGQPLFQDRPEGCYEGPAIDKPARFSEVVLSVDAAFKGQAQHDRVAMLAVATCKPPFQAMKFVLDRRTRNMTFTETLAGFVQLVKDFPDYHFALIEEAANGAAILDVLKKQVPRLNPDHMHYVVTPSIGGNKANRAWASQPELQSGNWYLPDGAPWLQEWIETFERFPSPGAHDDDVDAFSQGAAGLRGAASGLEVWRNLARYSIGAL